MKTIPSAYNSRMRGAAIAALVIFLAAGVPSQQRNNGKPAANASFELPKASLWSHYEFQFQSHGGNNGPYRWRLVSGALPHGLKLEEDGRLSGEINEQQESNFAVLQVDRAGKQELLNCILRKETPLMSAWEEKAHVSGNRIDGSVKVSNTTGRDFDLTFAVLAVNDIGRATAIGYQHFPLRPNTRDMKLPFGDTLPPGNYTVNVDVVGEEPQSRMVFRARLVTQKLAITTGP